MANDPAATSQTDQPIGYALRSASATLQSYLSTLHNETYNVLQPGKELVKTLWSLGEVAEAILPRYFALHFEQG